MAYNTAGYNTFASNEDGVLESGVTTATATTSGTDASLATESGATTSAGLLTTTDASIATESGAITSQGLVSLINADGFNTDGYNAGSYNDESGEMAFGFESGTTNSNGTLNSEETATSVESGTVTATGALSITDLGFAIESGLISAVATLNATESTIPPVVRIYIRDAFFDIAESLELNQTFTLTRIIEFTESNTMTEIDEIDDTITNESRRLEFTAKEDGSVKDLTGATISWSLANDSGVVLDDSDSEVDVTIIDATNGRFNVEIDTFDTGAGVYRQRVEIEDSQGRITRSNGVYRLQEF